MPESPVTRIQLISVFAVALVLRLLRAAVRWDEVALAYAAYAEPALRAWENGRLQDLLSAWIGLHPPLYATFLASQLHLLPYPLLWLLSSAIPGALAAVLLTHRFGLPAGLFFATWAPALLQAAELDNYPLAGATLALLLWAHQRPTTHLLLAFTLTAWSHALLILPACVLLLHRIWTETRHRYARLAAACLLLLPLAAGVLQRLGRPSTFSQHGFSPGEWFLALLDRLGPGGALLVGLALLGLGGRPRGIISQATAILAGSWALALLTNVAAPHQFQYLALLAAPFSVGFAQFFASSSRGAWLASLICLVAALPMLRSDLLALRTISQDIDQERAIDRALERARAGDLLYLLAPALQDDDDKTDFSPVLWRIPPWSYFPPIRPVAFDRTDWRYGQPHALRGIHVHTTTELWTAPFDQLVDAAAHRRGTVHLVLYDHAPALGLEQRVERALRIYQPQLERFPRSSPLGDDLLFTFRPTSARP
jgi:hypothetical protein